MKGVLVGMGIVIGLVLGMATGSVESSEVGTEVRSQDEITWEYKVVVASASPEQRGKQLNTLGSQGWEWVGANQHPRGLVDVLKKPRTK